jgi:hypothetical protein
MGGLTLFNIWLLQQFTSSDALSAARACILISTKPHFTALSSWNCYDTALKRNQAWFCKWQCLTTEAGPEHKT